MFSKLLLNTFCVLFSVQAYAASTHEVSNREVSDWNKRVYLATYPRSGNHWMRYLLEEVTSIATSSVYCDPDPQHLSDPFPWGGYCHPHGYEGKCRYPVAGDIFVVKTHYPCLQAYSFDLQPTWKTVRIIRHPIDSMYSHYAYFSHGQKATDRMPLPILNELIQSWRLFQEYWDMQPNVLTVRYEDLMDDPAFYLSKILTYIGYSFTSADVERTVAKYAPKGKLFKHFKRYKAADLRLIHSKLHKLMRAYGYHIPRLHKQNDRNKALDE
jgi:hypothetical protein